MLPVLVSVGALALVRAPWWLIAFVLVAGLAFVHLHAEGP